MSVLENITVVFGCGLNFRGPRQVAQFTILNLPNVLIKASIIALIQLLMFLNPFNELSFEQSATFFIDSEMIENQSGDFLYQSHVTAGFYFDVFVLKLKIHAFLSARIPLLHFISCTFDLFLLWIHRLSCTIWQFFYWRLIWYVVLIKLSCVICFRLRFFCLYWFFDWVTCPLIIRLPFCRSSNKWTHLILFSLQIVVVQKMKHVWPMKTLRILFHFYKNYVIGWSIFTWIRLFIHVQHVNQFFL